MIRAAQHLHGERNAPELPIPSSAIRDYTERFRLSPTFGALVHTYDSALMAGEHGKMKELVKNGKGAKAS